MLPLKISCKPDKGWARGSFPLVCSWLSVEINLAVQKYDWLCALSFLHFCVFVLLSLSFRTFLGFALYVSDVTPPLCLNVSLVSFTSVSLHLSPQCIIFVIFFVLLCPLHILPPLCFMASFYISIFALNPHPSLPPHILFSIPFLPYITATYSFLCYCWLKALQAAPGYHLSLILHTP